MSEEFWYQALKNVSLSYTLEVFSETWPLASLTIQKMMAYMFRRKGWYWRSSEFIYWNRFGFVVMYGDKYCFPKRGHNSLKGKSCFWVLEIYPRFCSVSVLLFILNLIYLCQFVTYENKDLKTVKKLYLKLYYVRVFLRFHQFILVRAASASIWFPRCNLHYLNHTKIEGQFWRRVIS